MTLSQETARKLRLMKMGEIVDIVEGQDAIAENWNMNFHERMDNLVDQLYQIKNNKRIDTLCSCIRSRTTSVSILFAGRPDSSGPRQMSNPCSSLGKGIWRKPFSSILTPASLLRAQRMSACMAQPDAASPTPHVQSESQPAAIATGCAMSASRT